MLGLKIELKPDREIDDSKLTVDEITELLKSLALTRQRIRADIYSTFLSTKQLYKELLFVGLLFLFYLATDEMFYVYFMPVSVLISMIGRIVSAEVLVNKTKTVIQQQIDYYKNLRKQKKAEAN